MDMIFVRTYTLKIKLTDYIVNYGIYCSSNSGIIKKNVKINMCDITKIRHNIIYLYV